MTFRSVVPGGPCPDRHSWSAAPIRESTFVMRAFSAWRRAEETIRATRPALGCSMPSARQHRRSASRTRSARRSCWQPPSTRNAVSFSASSTVHSQNPRKLRIWARWYSTVRPSNCKSPARPLGRRPGGQRRRWPRRETRSGCRGSDHAVHRTSVYSGAGDRGSLRVVLVTQCGFVGTRGEDRDTLRTLVDRATERLPGLESSDLGGISSL